MSFFGNNNLFNLRQTKLNFFTQQVFSQTSLFITYKAVSLTKLVRGSQMHPESVFRAHKGNNRIFRLVGGISFLPPLFLQN